MPSIKRWEKLVDLPQDAGNFVDMVNFNGTLFVAMQGGIFQLMELPISDPAEPLSEEPSNG